MSVGAKKSTRIVGKSMSDLSKEVLGEPAYKDLSKLTDTTKGAIMYRNLINSKGPISDLEKSVSDRAYSIAMSDKWKQSYKEYVRQANKLICEEIEAKKVVA